MKPIKSIFNLTISIALINLFFSSCVECKNENAEGNYSKPCEEVLADAIPNQLIIEFDNQVDINYIYEFLDKMQDNAGEGNPGADTIYTCFCSNKLALLTFPDDKEVKLEPAQTQANETINGDGQKGRAYINKRIKIATTGNFLGDSIVSPVGVEDDDIVIAVIDGGIWEGDPKVCEHFWSREPEENDTCQYPDITGYDFTRRHADYLPIINAHGTIVSHTIVDQIDDDVNFRLMDLRVFDTSGTGTLYDVLCAINFAIDNDADIINMSFGYYTEEVDSIFLHYMDTLRILDKIVVASAGNDSINTDSCYHFPSGFRSDEFGLGNIISVAALNNCKDGLKPYSNFGRTTISIAAPVGNPDISGLDNSGPFKGTSFAAPVVTGKVVQLFFDHPEYENHEKINSIMTNSVSIEGLKVICEGRLED